MLFSKLGRALLAASALATPFAAADDADNPTGQSTFISPDKSLAFAFTVPDNGNADIYFSLRVSTKRSWGAVGLGSDDMPGALFLIIYQDYDGHNITFSPRLAYGNYEPKYYPDLNIDYFDGTGLSDDYMTLHASCSNCRNWPGGKTSKGYIDVTSPNQNAIYALGPKENFGSDAVDAPLKFHEEYGTFTIDMKRTQGRPDLPVLNIDSVTEGTTLNSRKTKQVDWKAAVHATFMVFAFMGLLPIGAILVRVEKFAKFHKINQTVGLLFVQAGFAFGVLLSFNYQRSRGFNSYHQIVGFVVNFFMLVQLILGILHHIEWSKTKQPTKFGMFHKWVGRCVLFIGFLNGYVGFSFAQDRKYGVIVAAIVFFSIFASFAFLIWGAKGNRRRQQVPGGGFENYTHGGYPPQQQPWRRSDSQAAGGPAPAYSNDPPPGYEAPAGNINLQSVSPWRSSNPQERSYEDDPDLGSMQKPRDFA